MSLSLSKLSLLASVGAGAVALLSAQAGAVDHPLYISMFGGASMLNDVNTINQEGKEPYSVGFSTGYIIGGVIGAQLTDRLRAEAELSHAVWQANHMSVTARTEEGHRNYAGTATGPLNATYLLANVWYDLPTGGTVTPYIGGGAGVGWANANLRFSQSDPVEGEPGDGYGNGGMGFAYQLGAGFRVPLSEKLELDAGYRLKGITGINFKSVDRESPYNGANLISHNFQIGLTFQF